MTVLLAAAPFLLIGVMFWFGKARVVSAAALPIAGSGFCPRTRKESSAANYPWPARPILPPLWTGPPLSNSLLDDQSSKDGTPMAMILATALFLGPLLLFEVLDGVMLADLFVQLQIGRVAAPCGQFERNGVTTVNF